MIIQATLSRKSIHFWIYYGSLCLLVSSLPASRYMLTISLILLIVNWLVEANFREKFKKFLNNKPAIAFTLIYGLSLVGLLWSQNLGYALRNDLLHKSPTLFMPIIIVTSPMLDARKIRLLLILFVLSVLAVSFIGLSLTLNQPHTIWRDASPFMPGLYYGMMIILAAFQLPLLVRQISDNRALLFLSLVISVWLIVFLFYMRTLSGIASFAGVWFFLIAFFILRQKSTIIKISLVMVFMLIFSYVLWILAGIYNDTNSENHIDLSTLDKYTENGSPYYHDTTCLLRENGNLVIIYIANDELKDEWNKRSKFEFYSNGTTDKSISFTLHRYMSSKGLRKDKNDFMLLTDSDIRAIESGIANYKNISRPGFYIRLYEEMVAFYNYRKSSYKDAPVSSLTERIDIWRASWLAFRKHPLLGWGTGSILNATDYGLEINKSELLGKNMKPHNQYLYILLTLGLLGLISCILLYTYIIVKTEVYKIFMFKVFIIVFAINFLANNSIESQLGQNLFVFFSLFYCFFYPQLKTERTVHQQNL